MSSKSLKNEITNKLIGHIVYIYFNVNKQITEVKLLQVHCNTWNQLNVSKKRNSVSRKCLQIMNIFNIQFIYIDV